MSEEKLKLENQICFKLYAAEREVTKLYRPLLKELEITYPQYLVLLVLWEIDTITVKELGKRLYLDSGTLTPMLKRMEANVIIERKRSEVDERIVNISLTEKGKKMQERAECVPTQLLENLSIESDDLKKLNGILSKILNQ
ncbi:MarR family winged helix-turn-helix transcriptional regulator [Falsibacillus albus]|uniref:HTH-type transcriptional regulator SarZ n=1 Tax=Falsibacillus albus TaxID=2478915 RepID=A0A3L7JJK0_9BACI|nr:MarR family transcriptional regulator [Falsibacillus albus]RLQ90624.1 MarR family transcriptional regulator [Falsibacillus albus]